MREGVTNKGEGLPPPPSTYQHFDCCATFNKEDWIEYDADVGTIKISKNNFHAQIMRSLQSKIFKLSNFLIFSEPFNFRNIKIFSDKKVSKITLGQ